MTFQIKISTDQSGDMLLQESYVRQLKTIFFNHINIYILKSIHLIK